MWSNIWAVLPLSQISWMVSSVTEFVLFYLFLEVLAAVRELVGPDHRSNTFLCCGPVRRWLIVVLQMLNSSYLLLWCLNWSMITSDTYTPSVLAWVMTSHSVYVCIPFSLLFTSSYCHQYVWRAAKFKFFAAREYLKSDQMVRASLNPPGNWQPGC